MKRMNGLDKKSCAVGQRRNFSYCHRNETESSQSTVTSWQQEINWLGLNWKIRRYLATD